MHTITVRVTKELYYKLRSASVILDIKHADFLRDLLAEQLEVVLSSPIFQKRLEAHEERLSQLRAYAPPPPLPEDPGLDFDAPVQ